MGFGADAAYDSVKLVFVCAGGEKNNSKRQEKASQE
jgi:hypothetical protein